MNHLVAPGDEAVAFDFMARLEGLIRLAERAAFGPSTQAILDEAASRDIPYIRLDRHSLVQLGQGVHQQRIRATMTSKTSGIAVDIASDKSLTNRLLDSAGLPVPKSMVVDTEDGPSRPRSGSASLRGQAARRQPRPGRPPDLRSEDAVRAAFRAARESRSGDLVVESYVAATTTAVS